MQILPLENPRRIVADQGPMNFVRARVRALGSRENEKTYETISDEDGAASGRASDATHARRRTWLLHGLMPGRFHLQRPIS